MTEALAVVFLILTAIHIIGALGYAAAGGKPATSTFFQTLGVADTVVAIALAIAVVL